MPQPSSETAIDLLTQLKKQLGSSILAYWVTPNTILTLSGARPCCDGVFYSDNKNVLSKWQKEIKDSIKVMKSLVEIPFSTTSLTKNPIGDYYAGYDLFLMPGLKYSLQQTRLLGQHDKKIILSRMPYDKKFVKDISKFLKHNKQLVDYSDEELQHTASGIMLGYPDKAILESVKVWSRPGPFDERLVDADIRGADYYNCPQPVYSYPRQLKTDPVIIANEQLWSGVLKNYYNSGFHKELEKDKNFNQKAKELGLKD